jgi:hypothetical protein
MTKREESLSCPAVALAPRSSASTRAAVLAYLYCNITTQTCTLSPVKEPETRAVGYIFADKTPRYTVIPQA